jgi:hypothetical protein
MAAGPATASTAAARKLSKRLKRLYLVLPG